MAVGWYLLALPANGAYSTFSSPGWPAPWLSEEAWCWILCLRRLGHVALSPDLHRRSAASEPLIISPLTIHLKAFLAAPQAARQVPQLTFLPQIYQLGDHGRSVFAAVGYFAHATPAAGVLRLAPIRPRRALGELRRWPRAWHGFGTFAQPSRWWINLGIRARGVVRPGPEQFDWHVACCAYPGWR